VRSLAENMNYRRNNCLGKHSRETGKLKEDGESISHETLGLAKESLVYEVAKQGKLSVSSWKSPVWPVGHISPMYVTEHSEVCSVRCLGCSMPTEGIGPYFCNVL